MRYLVFFISLLTSFQLWAAATIGAKSAGLGNTGRAAVENVESLYLNPAAFGLVNKFHMGTGFYTGLTDQGVERDTYGITFTDGTKGVMIPGSLGYRFHEIYVDGREFKEQEFRAAVGKRLSQRFSVGAAFTYIKGENPEGSKYDMKNVDLGVLFGIMPNWGLGLTAEGIVRPKDDIQKELQRGARIALSTQYIFKDMLTMRYEALAPLYDQQRQSQFNHKVGLGMSMQGDFVLNAGYSWDNILEQTWGSLGLAWEGPRLKFAYSIQNETQQKLGVRHFVDLWLDI